MFQRTCRIWNLTIATLLALTVYNIISSFRSTPEIKCPKITFVKKDSKFLQAQAIKANIAQPINTPFLLDINLGRWDNKLEYKFFDNALLGTNFVNLSKNHKTCLATQSSLEKLHSIVEVASHWDGPISLALFGSGDEDFNNLVLYILYLRECYPNIKEKANIHFAFPAASSPSRIRVSSTLPDTLDCEESHNILLHLTKSKQKKRFMRWKNQVIYPQNHLRNLARKNCQSDYVFLTDIDIVPSYGMVKLLDEFLVKDNCGNKMCAFVIPTFELDNRVRFPPNKSELLRLADKGLARPFHQKVFIYNQFATNFSRWKVTRDDGPKIHVNHVVTNYEFLYEPFYVAKDTVPIHDERFVGYGYTRNTQVYEMHLAGYKFLVLSPIFTIHWGLQAKVRPAWRESQNAKNMKKFEKFKQEISIRYNRDSHFNMINKKPV